MSALLIRYKFDYNIPIPINDLSITTLEIAKQSHQLFKIPEAVPAHFVNMASLPARLRRKFAHLREGITRNKSGSIISATLFWWQFPLFMVLVLVIV